jgi:hypothetical protein
MIRQASTYQELLDLLEEEGIRGVQCNRLPNCKTFWEVKLRNTMPAAAGNIVQKVPPILSIRTAGNHTTHRFKENSL